MWQFLANSIIRHQNSLTHKSVNNPMNDQADILRKTVKLCSDTEIGRAYELKAIKCLADAKKLPVTRYADIKPKIEKIYRLGKNGEGIMSWSTLQGFAMTSGTTGGTKYFPVTKNSLNDFQKSSAQLLNALYFQAITMKPMDFFYNKAIALAAAPLKKYSPTGLPIGYMSGYLLVHTHPLVRRLIYPSNEIAYKAHWQDRISSLLIEAKGKNILFLIGFPAAIKIFTLDALAYFKKNFLQEIWPNLNYCLYGGNKLTAEDRKLINLLWTGRESDRIKFYENYSAVEGFFGYTFQQEWPGLVFNTRYNFFQFKINESDTEFLQLHELAENKEYLIYVTNPHGLINYAMNDVIKITSLKPLTFQFSYRTQEQISLIAEKILLEEIQSSIEELNKNYQLAINDFVVWLDQGATNKLMFGISYNDKLNVPSYLLEFLDQQLRSKNFIYNDYREDNIYSQPGLTLLSKEVFDIYRRRNIDKGNFKEKRLFNSRTEFIKTYELTANDIYCL